MQPKQDGETSLKTKSSPAMTKGLQSLASIADFRGFLECENPNPKLDSFLGRITKMEGPSKKVGWILYRVTQRVLYRVTHLLSD